jgi:membrane protein
MASTASEDRGRHADRPHDIPADGWRDILWRVHAHLLSERHSIVAAGIAFYALMAVFPGLIALVCTYGTVYKEAELAHHLDLVAAYLPPHVAETFTGQIHQIIALNGARLRVGSVFAVLVSLWTASAGMRALMDALNITYHESTGPLGRFYARSLVFTVGALACAMVTIALIFGAPLYLRGTGVQGPLYTLLFHGRWLVLAGGALLALAVLYRYGPSRRKARWQWVTVGAAVATGLWIIASGLFYTYIVHFDRYNAIYGSLGGVLVVLTWFLITAWSLMLGGEINAQMERQTEKDTTEGPARPLGERGARAADTVGKTPSRLFER